MFLYDENHEYLLDLDNFCQIASTYETEKDGMNDKFIVFGRSKYDFNVTLTIHQGTEKECDDYVKQIANAIDRGQEMLWIKPGYLTQASDEYV